MDSGLAAVERYSAQAMAEWPFDVLLLDWRMPGMDGLAAGKLIRQTTAIGQDAHRHDHRTFRGAARQPVPCWSTSSLHWKPITASSFVQRGSRAKRKHGLSVPPATSANVARAAAARLAGAGGGRQRDQLRTVAQRILEAEGALVTTDCADGRQAVEWLATNAMAVDAVLMDIRCGAGRLRRDTADPRRARLTRLPVVALTAGASRTNKTPHWRPG